MYLRSFRISAARSSARSSARTTQHQMQRGLLLDVVVAQRAAVLQLLAREDEALLVGRRNARLVLDLLLHVLRNERNQRQNFQTKRYAQRRKATAATQPTQQSQSTK